MLRMDFIGGRNCVIAAFDERLPAVNAALAEAGHPLAGRSTAGTEDDDDPALAEVDDLATDLYKTQDALAFVAECCDVADRMGGTITTAHVRRWLEGAKCGRQLLAERTTDHA